MASRLNATQVVNNLIWLERINENTSWRFDNKHKKLKQTTILLYVLHIWKLPEENKQASKAKKYD